MADPKYNLTIETDNAASVVKQGSSEGKVNLRFSVGITNKQPSNMSLKIHVQKQFVKSVRLPMNNWGVNVEVDDFIYDKNAPMTVKVEQSGRTNVYDVVEFPFNKPDTDKASAVDRIKATPSKHLSTGFVPVLVQTFDGKGKPVKSTVQINPNQGYIVDIGGGPVTSTLFEIVEIETDDDGKANISIKLLDQNGRVMFTEQPSGKHTEIFILKR